MWKGYGPCRCDGERYVDLCGRYVGTHKCENIIKLYTSVYVHKPQQNPIIKGLKKQGKGKTTHFLDSHFIHTSFKITVTFIKNNTYS